MPRDTQAMLNYAHNWRDINPGWDYSRCASFLFLPDGSSFFIMYDEPPNPFTRTKRWTRFDVDNEFPDDYLKRFDRDLVPTFVGDQLRLI